MINGKGNFKYCFNISILVLAILLVGTNCYAGEGTSSFRHIYDNVMLFLNFGILVFLFFKYAKQPLIDFLKGEGNKIKSQLDELEEKLSQARNEVEAEEQKIKNIEVYLEEIQKNILSLAQREKEKIIKDARVLSEKMIEDARSYTEYEINKAKKILIEDAVDTAIAIVEKKLTKGFSKKNDDSLIEAFLQTVDKYEPSTYY